MSANEFKIAKAMSEEKGFPKVYGEGTHEGKPYIILEKLGPSIDDLFTRRFGEFSLLTVMNIGISLINLIKKMHEKGFVHCDLKPDNILIGIDNEGASNVNQLHLIDFGISKAYLDDQGNHVPMIRGHR